MTRFVIPVVLVAAAVGLFVLYTNPWYQEAKKLSGQVAAYDDALDKSKQLLAKRDELTSKQNAFRTEDRDKLETMLPDNVDNIRLVIDVNAIAARHGLSLKNVSLGQISGGRDTPSAAAAGTSGDPIGSVQIGFSVGANYDSFLAFLQDLEHSLRIIDVEKLNFKADPKGTNEIDFTIRTYWLH